MVYLFINVCHAVVPYFVVGQLAYPFLWPLTRYPLLCFLAADTVTLNDALYTYLSGGRYYYHLVHQLIGP